MESSTGWERAVPARWQDLPVRIKPYNPRPFPELPGWGWNLDTEKPGWQIV